MGTRAPEAVGRRVPVVTGLVVAGALGAYAAPDLASWLIYDRGAILSGEVWRLVTGSWVHFSRSHLLYDLVAFGIAGAVIERRGYARFALLCALSALSIGLALLALVPDLAYYGGLSGVAFGALVYLALHALREEGPGRWLAAAVLGLAAGKVLLEATTGRFAVVAPGAAPFVPAPLAHLAGAAAALGVFCGSRKARLAQAPCRRSLTSLGDLLNDGRRSNQKVAVQ